MRVKCEKCNTNFNLDESLVKSTGSKVRCSKCKHIFVAYPPEPETEEPVVETPAVDAEQDAGAAFQAPLDEFQPDHDADVADDEAASDTSLRDETSAEEVEGEDLDLSDIEKMLEAEETPDTLAEEPAESFSQEDTGSGDDEESLDLSDIEKILDEEDDSDELIEEKTDEDEDLVFDLDEALEMEAVEEQISPTTELDLGDLEKMFESEEALEISEDEEISPALDLDAEEEGLFLMTETEEGEAGEGLTLEAEEETAALEPEDGGDLLGFDMESSVEEDEAPQMTDEEKSPTLDIEIEEDDISLEEVSEADEAEAEPLDIKIDPDVESPEAEVEGLEIESEIEPELPGFETKEPEVSEASGVEDSAEAEASLSDALELAIESQDEEQELEGVEGTPAEDLEDEAGEDELMDFGEEEELEYPDDSVPDIPDEEEISDEEESDLGEGHGERAFEEDYEEVAVETRGGGVKKLLALLAVVLVIILLLAAFLFLHYKSIIHVPYLDQLQIPFLTKQKTSQVEDVGNLYITYNVDNYRFLETEKAGKLFLITGKVKNEYSMPRSFVQVTGSLYTNTEETEGKTLADTATAYCGNVIADLELKQMTPAAIRTRLGNRSGESNSNVNIKPGEERPFMIVFFDLPESLDEFTVAVVESSAGDT